MNKLKYINKVNEVEFLNGCKVELWDFSRSNENEEARIEAVTTVASLSYGNKYARNPQKLYELLKERGHNSVFEFIRNPFTDISGECISDGIEDSLRHRFDLPYSKDDTDKYDIQTQRRCYNACIAVFKVRVPIFVARQIMRHRSFSFLEMSRRYTKDNKVEFEFYHPVFTLKELEQELPLELIGDVERHFIKSRELYNKLLEVGIKPELARAVIPVAAFTEFWMMGGVKAWAYFFKLRLAKDAQFETRKTAEAMRDLIIRYQPQLWDNILRYQQGGLP